MEYIDFVVETIGSLENDKFEMLKKALIGEYLSFSIIQEDKVSKEELSEKVCDYFEKMILKSGKNFDKLIESYTKGIDYVVSNKIAKPTQSKKNKSVQEDIPRARMEIIKNNYSVIDNFDFSANVLKPDVIINGMKMKEDFRIVKKKYFNIKELYSIDTCTFIIAIIILHTIINERI